MVLVYTFLWSCAFEAIHVGRFFQPFDRDPTVRNTPQSIIFSVLPELSSRLPRATDSPALHALFHPRNRRTLLRQDGACRFAARFTSTPSSKAISVSSSPSCFFDAARRQRKQRVTFFFLCHNPGEPLAPRNPINSESARKTGCE